MNTESYKELLLDLFNSVETFEGIDEYTEKAAARLFVDKVEAALEEIRKEKGI